MVIGERFSLLPDEQTYLAWGLMASSFILTPSWLLYSDVPNQDADTESYKEHASWLCTKKMHFVRGIWSICVTFSYFTITLYW